MVQPGPYPSHHQSSSFRAGAKQVKGQEKMLSSSAPHQSVLEWGKAAHPASRMASGVFPWIQLSVCSGVGPETSPVPQMELSVLGNQGQASLSHQCCLLEFISDSEIHLISPFITSHSGKLDRLQNGNWKPSPHFLPCLLLCCASR